MFLKYKEKCFQAPRYKWYLALSMQFCLQWQLRPLSSLFSIRLIYRVRIRGRISQCICYISIWSWIWCDSFFILYLSVSDIIPENLFRPIRTIEALSLCLAFALIFSLVKINLGTMFKIHTLPIFALRPMYLAIRKFRKSLSDIVLSRRAIAQLEVYPNATEADLANDNICIICREEMVPGPRFVLFLLNSFIFNALNLSHLIYTISKSFFQWSHSILKILKNLEKFLSWST